MALHATGRIPRFTVIRVRHLIIFTQVTVLALTRNGLQRRLAVATCASHSLVTTKQSDIRMNFVQSPYH